jgi:hypothetical protein
MKSFLEYIIEKQIQYGKNANYGQVVFFAGGAGSGKGFSISNYIDSSKFKIKDVDQIKLLFLKIPQILEKYPELKNFSLKNPEHVSRLHQIVSDEKISEKQLKAFFGDMKNPNTLPNILFDATLKNVDKEFNTILPMLLSAGYKPEHIHITWVLANYAVAVVNNRERERVVPEDIMLKTHTGVALSMEKLLSHGLPKHINGSFTIILNNPENVSFYETDTDKKHIKKLTVKDFKYIKIKDEGKPMIPFKEMDSKIKETVISWVLENAPKTQELENVWSKNR